jgi:hypothetical protein
MVLKRLHPQEVGGQGVDLMQPPKTKSSNVVMVFAVDETETHSHTVTEQGFGISTPLSKPVKKTIFRWEGKLHGSGPNVGGSSNSNLKLVSLAENWSSEYMRTKDLASKGMKEPPYALDFSAPPDVVGARELTLAERELFLDAFRQANRDIVKNRKK